MMNDGNRHENTPDMSALAAHVRSVYTANAEARTVVSEQIRQAKMALDMTYSPEIIESIKSGLAGSKTYYPIIKIKARSAAAWLRKILTSAVKPWSITPTPDPDLDDSVVEQITAAAMREGQRIGSMGMNMELDDYYQFALDMRNLVMGARNEAAEKAANQAETLIDDRLVEAGFREAFDVFLSDFVLYPAAFLRASTTQETLSRVMKSPDPQTGEMTYRMVKERRPIRRFERISPVQVFPSAGQKCIEEGDIIIVNAYSLSEIQTLADLPGYNREEIAQLQSDLRSITADSTGEDAFDRFPEAKYYSVDSFKYRHANRLPGLEFYGSVPGEKIIEWAGRPQREEGEEDYNPVEDEVEAALVEVADAGIPLDSIDPEKIYEVHAITIVDRCVYCRITDDEPRWLFSASFERNPDSIWGSGIADMLHFVQQDVNSTRRATINNLWLSSYPQTVVNDDILQQNRPGGKGMPLLYPGKVWHIRNGFGGSSKPVEFFNIPSVYQALSTEFEKSLIMADRVSGIPEYSQGLAQGAQNGAAGTASGLSMLLEAAGNQIKDPVNNLDKGVIEPIVRLSYAELLDDPEVDNAAKGDFKIVALGANGLMFKEQTVQKRRDFLSLVLQSPTLMQLVKPEGVVALVRDIAETLGMPVDKIVPSETEYQAIKEQQELFAQQQAAMAQAQPQPGSEPVEPGEAQPEEVPVTVGSEEVLQ